MNYSVGMIVLSVMCGGGFLLCQILWIRKYSRDIEPFFRKKYEARFSTKIYLGFRGHWRVEDMKFTWWRRLWIELHQAIPVFGVLVPGTSLLLVVFVFMYSQIQNSIVFLV